MSIVLGRLSRHILVGGEDHLTGIINLFLRKDKYEIRDLKRREN
jgi:hypothetical protein